MTVLLAGAFWCFHGLILWWNWGKFRPHIALLHGVGMAAVAFLLVWVGLPAWALGAAGLAVGAVGGWGHRLAPGLWVGVLLLLPLPFLLDSASLLQGGAVFALWAQLAAAMAAFVKSSL